MVSIAIPKNSYTDLINAGLTTRYYKTKGVESKIHYIAKNKINDFWENIQDYVDDEDHILIILNLSLSSNETLKKIDIEPYDYSILYIPNKLIVITPKNKKTLFEKGIVSMPQRNSYKCYLGDYNNNIEKKWMKINELISFEKDLKYVTKNRKEIIKGFIKIGLEDPEKTINNISNNNDNFFKNIGSEVDVKIYKHIIHDDPYLNISFTNGTISEILPLAICNYLSTKKAPIGINGEEDTIILTNAPTYDNLIIDDWDYNLKEELKIGKGSMMVLDKPSEDLDYEEKLLFLFGRLSQNKIIIKFENPKYTIKKTLIRRLCGGPGPGNRSYRGLKDRYPDISIMDRNVLSIPRDAVENVIDTLKETGSDFQIII